MSWWSWLKDRWTLVSCSECGDQSRQELWLPKWIIKHRETVHSYEHFTQEFLSVEIITDRWDNRYAVRGTWKVLPESKIHPDIIAKRDACAALGDDCPECHGKHRPRERELERLNWSSLNSL